MELLKKPVKLFAILKKYRFVILIFFIGIVLMSMPTTDETKKPSINKSETTAYQYSVTDELSQILSQIEGVGDTRVILSTSRGEETIYQTDLNQTTEDNSNRSDIDTVVITNSDRGQQGLVRQIIPASYMGAIVVCEGADDPKVRLSVVDAIAKFTGLGTNKISVLKMK